MIFYMLCREIWFYELPQPFSTIGYLLEPLYVRLLSSLPAITISDSTRQDLLRRGFKADNITVIPVGIELQPVADLSNIQKFTEPTLLSLGAMRSMKRTLDQLKAFQLAKAQIPNLRLMVAGDNSSRYGQQVMRAIDASPYKTAIDYLGRVSQTKKVELMQKSHLILVTSVKEGWGLIVTEAASQGTPAIVYNVDGLRDSVRDGVSGLVVQTNTPRDLADRMEQLLKDPEYYSKMRLTGWAWSKEITFDRSYSEFIRALNI